MQIRRQSVLVLAAALLLFLIFGLAWVSRPGLYMDEMLFLNGAFPSNSGVNYVGSIRIFKHDVPLMLMPYVGATKGLLWRLIFSVWTPSVYSARVPIVLLGGLALLLFFLWARRYYSAGVASLAVLLAAADPSYIFTSRLDWGPVVIQRLLMAAGLLLSARWLESAQATESGNPSQGAQRGPAAGVAAISESAAASPAPALATQQTGSSAGAGTRPLLWLGAAGFCFGLGLWDKTSFAWFLIALGITLLVLFPHEVSRRLKPAPVAVFVLAFLLGAFPLLRYNFSKQSSGKTLNAVHITLRPAEIADKLGKIPQTLDGSFVHDWVAGWAFDAKKAEANADSTGKVLALGSKLAPKFGSFFPWALLLALVAACFASGKRRLLFFPIMISALMWVQVLPLREGGGAHHFVLAYPFPHLALAAAAGWAWDRRRSAAADTGISRRAVRGAYRFAPVAVVAAVLISMVGWDIRTVWLFRETGGAWNWSDSSEQMAAFLEKNPPRTLMCMDWGFSLPLLLLSHGRLNQRDFFADVVFSPPEEFPQHVQRVIPTLLEPNTLFLFHTPGLQCFPKVREVFNEALAQTGMREQVVATFKMRNGGDLAVISRAVPGSGEQAEAPQQKLAFRITPAEVSPGDRYTVECPELAGKEIDLMFVRATEQAEVATRFSRLDAKGEVSVATPKLIPKGKIYVLAVRESGTEAWRPVPANAAILVK